MKLHENRCSLRVSLTRPETGSRGQEAAIICRGEAGRREAEGLIKVTQPLSGGRAWLQPPPSPGGPLSAADRRAPRPGPAIAPGQRLTLARSHCALQCHQSPLFLLSCDPEQPHLRRTKLPACLELSSRKLLPRKPRHALLTGGWGEQQGPGPDRPEVPDLTAPGSWAPGRWGAWDKGQGCFACSE